MQSTSSQRELWLRKYHPGPEGNGPVLVCFPHAGGAATAFRPLSGDLSAHAEVWSLQYPGRQDRHAEAPATRLDALADAAAAQLGAYTGRPLVLYGHSLGALVAYETARRLEDAFPCVDLAGLLVSGAQAPSVPRSLGVHLRDDDGVIDEIRKLGGTAPELLADPDVRRMILPAVRGDYEALETYRFRAAAPRLRCPVSALIGSADAQTTEGGARLWEETTAGGFGLRTFPGGHFFTESHRPQVAEALAEDIRSFTHAARRIR
ncbi:thioesterase II family protein [Streptomyces sp. NPDC006487]|uniref:thioesterase II family protein n=1 Tax=Streptomyces sp. NPDC006487 TaxID=3364748 RepID=UPI0036B293A5